MTSVFSHPCNSYRDNVSVTDGRIVTEYLEPRTETYPVITAISVQAPDHDAGKVAAQELAETIKWAIGKTDYGLEILKNPRLRRRHPELAAPHERAIAATQTWVEAQRAKGWPIKIETVD